MISYQSLTFSLLCIFLLSFAVFAADAGDDISYTLQDIYAGADFFSNFNFFTDVDPTHGFVK